MRRFLLAALALIVFLIAGSGGSHVVSASNGGLVFGDADCNAAVNPLDALGVMQHVADTGGGASCIAVADVNCDGTVDQHDAIELLRYSADVAAGNIPGNCAQINSAIDLPPLTLGVQGSIEVPPDIPSVDGTGPARSLAAIEDDEGNQTVFVAEELLIVTDDTAALNAFLARWNATVLTTLKPRDYGIDAPNIYLVHLEPSGLDTGQIADDLRKVNPLSWGEFNVSGNDAAQLLAAAAQEAANGMPVDLNWVLQADDYDQRDLKEGPSGPVGWNPNPYTWKYMNRGSPQDIGVADAWRALDSNVKLGNKVTISILDGGFAPNADFPAGYSVHGSTGVENPATCTGGSSCPWHGTMVTAAAMGVPGNNYGVAGPAGPVAKAVITQSPSPDILSYLKYIFIDLPTTALEGPDIINISAGSGIAREFCLTGICLAMDGIMRGVRLLDMLVFAAAGNDHTNVDAERCIDLLLGSICYEKTTWLPCELDDVICVGGLGDNSTGRASGSNYGTASSNTVDIFGPFYQYQTPDPQSGTIKYGSCGTSCATPFVAGVAALIKAADPNLGADGIEDALMSSSHKNSSDPYVKRWVNAYRAVITVMGGNEPPEIQIEGSDGDVYGGLPLEFSALVSDPEDRPTYGYPYNGLPSVQWQDSTAANLGTGPFISNIMLGYGQHTITATATDSKGYHVSDVRHINVINDPPSINIISPANGATFYAGQDIKLRATSHDLNFPDGQLPDSALTWYEGSTQNTPLGTGKELHITLTQGDHTLFLTGNDGQAPIVQASVLVHVTPPPADLPPTAVIDGIDVSNICTPGVYEIVFNGHANDNEDGPLTGASLVWRVDGVVIGTGTSLHVPTGNITQAQHVITLTATDSNNGTGVDTEPFYRDTCVG